MYLEIWVLLVLLASLLLNIYFIRKTAVVRKATRVLGLEKMIQASLYQKACRRYELDKDGFAFITRNGKPTKLTIMALAAEEEFSRAANIARSIGYDASLDWNNTFEQFRPTPRKLGECSDPSHGPL